MTDLELNYPDDLPVTHHRAEICAALKAHPVVIVSGDTGSGKTTQLPKMALECGGGRFGRRIAVTQPRRLAAVTMAARVAAELKSEVGGLVGYQHRFGREVSSETSVKFMTDGVLLAETRSDPLLRRYDTIIVDEAHERSLNVDFLLGILKRILRRRHDLKVIVSSATMDTDRFATFFDHAPVIAVPGRLFPIDYRYLPPGAEEERDLAREVADAVAVVPPHDDILVFLPGERDIRETADMLTGRYGPANEIIPLLASLPAGEQQRAFRPAPRRRIILATNVAETSVTIPGIRAVIDSGLARLSRYVHRTQVQRLQVEPISQASARQRAGRCGRLGPGLCLRLYAEDDLAARDAFTPPEVLRSSLAGVILTMLDLRLGDIADFPFIDPPRPTMVREGLRELLELGAIQHGGSGDETGDGRREVQLTPIGRKLAKIPVEPRLGRMLVAADDDAVLAAVLPVVAALSCDDPRRRPIDEREKADQAHAPFRVADSDFLGTLRLWNWWHSATKDLSQSKARALAKKTFLSYPKMREWRDLVRQLGALAKDLGLADRGTSGTGVTDPEDPRYADFAARFHRALLAGLLGHIGRHDEETNDYRGAHALRFALHPGSVLYKRKKTPPAWVMAGELVDTARLFARNAAVIDPAWLEPVAGNLCRRSYRAPEWDARSGFARVTEQVTLYGLVIVAARRRDLTRIDPTLARRILIEDGLVRGAFPRPPPVLKANLALLGELRKLAEKQRRPELMDEHRLFAHFDAILPADVVSADTLRHWLCGARPDEVRRFQLNKRDWWPSDDDAGCDYPDKIRLGGVTLALDYRHTPDDPETDGITCTVRAKDAHVLKLWPCEWLVPGALREKLVWMLSVLPSSLRRVLVPLDEKVSVLAQELRPGPDSLEDSVRRYVLERWGFRIAPDAWAHQRLPIHFQVRFVVRDDQSGRVLLATRDRSTVLSRFAPDANVIGHAPAGNAAPVISTCWTFGSIPAEAESERAGWTVRHYPALRDEGTGVSLRLYDDERTARRVHARGVTRLLRLVLPTRLRVSLRPRDLQADAARRLRQLDYSADRLSEDIYLGAIQSALVNGREPVRTEAEFKRRAETECNAIVTDEAEIRRIAVEALGEATRLADLAESDPRIPADTATDVETQLAWLVFRGFPAAVPLARLRHYARYLKAVRLRLERSRYAAGSDREKEAQFASFWTRYVEAATGKDTVRRDPEALGEYRWMLEEYRVSLFAQELRTAEPVSPKRLEAKWSITADDGRRACSPTA